jgi:hypothetical protein
LSIARFVRKTSQFLVQFRPVGYDEACRIESFIIAMVWRGYVKKIFLPITQ